MSLEYYLQPNPVTPDPNDQSARVATLSTRTEGELLFLTPALTTGTYRLEVRRTYGTATPVLRTGQLSTPLSVA